MNSKRPRTVFGKVRLEIDGKPVVIRMTKKEVIVRPLHARRIYRLPLARVSTYVMACAPLNQAAKQLHYAKETNSDEKKANDTCDIQPHGKVEGERG